MFKEIKVEWYRDYGNDPILQVNVDYDAYEAERSGIYEAVTYEEGYFMRSITDGICSYGHYRDAERGQLFTRSGNYPMKFYLQGDTENVQQQTFNSWSSSRAEIINAAFNVQEDDVDNYLTNVRVDGDRCILGDITLGKLSTLGHLMPEGVYMLLVRDNSRRKTSPGQLDVIPSLSPTELVYPQYKAWKHEQRRAEIEIVKSL